MKNVGLLACGIVFLANFSHFVALVQSVRLVKRKQSEKPFEVHLEPVWFDKLGECDLGEPLNSTQCEEASEEMKRIYGSVQNFLLYTEPPPDPRPLRCSMSFNQKGPRVMYNPFDKPAYEVKPGGYSHKSFVALCSGKSESKAFFQVGQEGTTCTSAPQVASARETPGGMLDSAICYTAALEAARFLTQQRMYAGKPLKKLMFWGHKGAKQLEDAFTRSPFGIPPTGCFSRFEERDNGFVVKVVFNEGDGPKTNSHWRPVCGSGAWRAAELWEPFQQQLMPHSLIQQNRSEGCDALSFASCCNYYTCNTCTSRRRHPTTSTTKCGWWADLSCCGTGSPCACR